MAAFVKTRASLEPTEVVTWIRGNIYGVVPGQPHRHLLGCEGYSIGWARAIDGGYRWLSRECCFFVDPVAGHIIDDWKNPLTGDANEVLHVWNDPVNEAWMSADESPVFGVETMGDDVHFTTDRFTLGPNPLPASKYRREVDSDAYQDTEFTRFIAAKSALDDDEPSARCHVSSVRITPYVPWMLMGDRPGQLMWHLGGNKLVGGYVDLPSHLRAYVEAKRPEFAFAPREFTSPNETLWTLYGKERGPRR